MSNFDVYWKDGNGKLAKANVAVHPGQGYREALWCVRQREFGEQDKWFEVKRAAMVVVNNA